MYTEEVLCTLFPQSNPAVSPSGMAASSTVQTEIKADGKVHIIYIDRVRLSLGSFDIL